MNLTNLRNNNEYPGPGLNIDFNYLSTNDSVLDAFLTQKGGDWKSTQGEMVCPSKFPWSMFLPAITGDRQ